LIRLTEALRIVEQDLQKMIGNQPLMAFAQRQHLGALQEAPHALGVFLLVHLSTLPFRAPVLRRAKERTLSEASCADMGRDPGLARPDRRYGYSREACRAMTIVNKT
jgi:hypothetical protein